MVINRKNLGIYFTYAHYKDSLFGMNWVLAVGTGGAKYPPLLWRLVQVPSHLIQLMQLVEFSKQVLM